MTPTFVLARMTRTRLSVLLPTAVLALFLASLLNVLLLVSLSPVVDADFRNAMIMSGEMAVIPFTIGLATVVADSIRPRMDQFASLLALGVRRRVLVRYLLLESLAISVAGCMLGAGLAPSVLRLLINTIYAPFHVAYPPGLALSAQGILIALLLVAGVTAVAALSASRRLRETHGSESPRRGLAAWFRLAVGGVFGGLGIILALAIAFDVSPRSLADTVALVLPLTAAASAAVALIIVSAVVDRISVGVVGWNWLGVAMRQIRVRPPAGIATLMVLLIAYPSTLFTYFGALTQGSRANAAHSFANVPVVSHSDGTLLSVAEAEALCDRIGSACVGQLQWANAVSLPGGGWGPVTPQGGQQSFVLQGTTPRVLDYVLTSRSITPNTSPYGSALRDPWHGVVDTPLPEVYGALVAVDGSPSTEALGDGVHVIDAPTWAVQQMPDRLEFGVTGGGTREVVPLFIFLLLGCVALVFGVTMTRQFRLVTTIDSLTALGLGRGRAMALRAVVNASPSAIAAAVTGLYCTLVSSAVTSALGGRAAIDLPRIPMDFFISIVVIALAAALLPTLMPVRRGAGAT